MPVYGFWKSITAVGKIGRGHSYSPPGKVVVPRSGRHTAPYINLLDEISPGRVMGITGFNDER